MSNDTGNPADLPIVNFLTDLDAQMYEPLTLAELIERARRVVLTVMEAPVYVSELGQHQFRAADGRWFKLAYALVPQAIATPECESCGTALTDAEAHQAPAVAIRCRRCAWHERGSGNQLALALA